MLMHNYFIYNGIDSRRYGIRISKQANHGAPERDQEFIGVPGRNGDVISDNGRWKNRSEVYECSIAKDFRKNFDSFRAAILASPGYHRLEDTYEPEEYYMAAITGSIEPSYNAKFDAGTFRLTFNRKPQRFLKSGEIEIERSSSFSIFNPTNYEARPLYKVNCGSTDTIILLYVGGMDPASNATAFRVYPILETAFSADSAGWEAAKSDGLWAYFDSDSGEAYAMYKISGVDTVVNLNAGVEVNSSGKLPHLPGDETTFVGNTGGKFSITPRWFTV